MDRQNFNYLSIYLAPVFTGAGSIDADAGTRFIRTEAAVAAITEAIDFSA